MSVSLARDCFTDHLYEQYHQPVMGSMITGMVWHWNRNFDTER